jgi:hypothetical protein
MRGNEEKVGNENGNSRRGAKRDDQVKEVVEMQRKNKNVAVDDEEKRSD